MQLVTAENIAACLEVTKAGLVRAPLVESEVIPALESGTRHELGLILGDRAKILLGSLALGNSIAAPAASEAGSSGISTLAELSE